MVTVNPRGQVPLVPEILFDVGSGHQYRIPIVPNPSIVGLPILLFFPLANQFPKVVMLGIAYSIRIPKMVNSKSTLKAHC
jgi:hypothetical protein